MSMFVKALDVIRNFFLCIGVTLASVRYLILGMETAFPNMLHQLDGRRLAFYARVIAGPIAMVIVPFQFRGKLRARRPNVHRCRLNGRAQATLWSSEI